MVVVVPLNDSVDVTGFIQHLIDSSHCNHVFKASPESSMTFASFASLKSRFVFYTCPSRDTVNSMDVIQTADLVLFVSSDNVMTMSDEPIDQVFSFSSH